MSIWFLFKCWTGFSRISANLQFQCHAMPIKITRRFCKLHVIDVRLLSFVTRFKYSKNITLAQSV